jgi:hypothetical protein
MPMNPDAPKARGFHRNQQKIYGKEWNLNVVFPTRSHWKSPMTSGPEYCVQVPLFSNRS